MQVDKFPLRRLPIDILMNVMKIMDGDQLISYSLISRTTKQNVIDLKMKLHFFTALIGSKLEINLTIPGYYRLLLKFDENKTVNWNPEENELLRLDNPEIVEVQCKENHEAEYKESLLLEKRGISVREWILHLFEIFHYPLMTSFHFFERSDRFDISFIRKTMEGLNVNRMAFELPLDVCYKLMVEINMFLTRITLNSNDLAPAEYLHKIVIQNAEKTTFNSRTLGLEDTSPFRIDDIMANNSENILLWCSVSSDKDLNRFLKLWINGSNPQLKRMVVGYGWGVIKDQLAIMKGISCRVMEKDERRERFLMQAEPWMIAARHGAFVVRRKDGVEVAVSFFPRWAFMEFTVWD
ncbi:unnamed protein product [Caenorhabditis brenneri]